MKKIFIIISIIIVLLCSYFAINKYIINSDIVYFNNKVVPSINIIDVNSNSRPIAVSINNNHSSWPHEGLENAYLCYELIAEGGITRILAFFKDKNISKIGSVRSARDYFLDYVLENDAIFVHYGHSPKALNDIKELKIDNINGMFTSSAFFRDKSLNKAYEHTAFTSSELINKYILKYNYRTTSNEVLFKYSPYDLNYSNDESIISAKEVIINYSKYTNTKYIYDENEKNYIQYMSDTIQYDNESIRRVKNIIVYKVENKVIDSKGRNELYNIGNGYGYYITNGNAIKIKWEKESRNDKTRYYDIYGNELIINDGNTWIHIEPIKEKLLIE